MTNELQPGSQLGPYRIEGVLGAGGMGCVYRATDTRLGRAVAVKVVKEQFSDRFQREARAISSLNHPRICTLYDVGPNYLVMELVKGQTLSMLLQTGRLPVDQALEYGTQIADALALAHAQGMVHRDLKPGNVMITANGVKVLDFGLAKHVEAGVADELAATLSIPMSQPGQVIGTLRYMSPEQAEGKAVDARSDLFALGVVLYEMLCGKAPFQGDTQLAILASILKTVPEPPRHLRNEISEAAERVVLRCLEKNPEARHESASEVRDALAAARQPAPKSLAVPKAAAYAAVLVIVIAGSLLGWRAYRKSSQARWVKEQAIPEISRLLNQDRLYAGLRVYRQALAIAPESRDLVAFEDRLTTTPASIRTTAPGAKIFIADYLDVNPDTGETADWQLLGLAPLKVAVPLTGSYRIRAELDGYETVEQTLVVVRDETLEIRMIARGKGPPGMAWIPGAAAGEANSMSPAPSVALAGFWLDQHEVTNRDFKAFVEAGGYRKKEYWQEPFVRDGGSVPWEEAVRSFRDPTGRPGPSTWQLGTYPEGTEDLPLGGVSWYEAAAYANFAGKSLPTVYHWYRAAGADFTSPIVRLSNFSSQKPLPVTARRGLARFHVYDMAGNVEEWTANPRGNQRYILGGAWTDPGYVFTASDFRDPFARGATFGFRCALYPEPPAAPLLGPVPFVSKDRRQDKPVNDGAYAVIRALYSYEKTPLDAAPPAVATDSPYWRKETVTFRAAYPKERVVAHLYLPKNAVPPYQVVVAFGGLDSLTKRSPEEIVGLPFFLVRAGRALLLPAYKGTLERGPGLPMTADQRRETFLRWPKDLSRSLDYLETRPQEFDTRKIAYWGLSFGSSLSPSLLALEPRIKAAVPVASGTIFRINPEIDPWNFEPRVTIPVLMLSGREDFISPLLTTQIPFFQALGTPAKDKRHILYPGGHADLLSRTEPIKETLDWLDKYLGPVNVRP